MANEVLFEQRLAAVERAVDELQRRLADGRGPSAWLEEVTGSVADEEAFREALEYGRAYRVADRPAAETDES